MVMDNYYNNTQHHQCQPEMLWRKINSLHLSYLEMEESPQKIEHKNKLETCIHSYLCVAHHNQKFECTTTPQVLHESARMPDFSGYRAAVGWDAIGRYAANLITKPWRREYRQIKMYSGFYKHEVESNLIGADEMFVEMGYKHVGNELLILTGPVCPDRLTSVSLDSLMAYVECQILKEIWEEVSKKCSVTWLEVLSLRETHAGSPQETINAMIYMKKMPPQVAVSNGSKSQSHPYYTNSTPAQPAPHNYPVYPAAPPHNCCSNFYLHHPPPQFAPYNYSMRPEMRAYYPQPCNTHANVSHVPTGQLIELYDQPDGGPSQTAPRDYSEMPRKMAQLYINDNAKTSSKKSDPVSERDDGSGTYESWDYVYRNLESQGYSKDLGERGDLLQEATHGNISANMKPENKTLKKERRESKHSTYDNVSVGVGPGDKNHKASMEQPHANANAIANTSNGHASTALPMPKTATIATATPVVQPAGVGVPLKGWQCTTCTFLNQNDKDICEICSKSRKKPVDQHLQVGGTQCEKCTFVNDKGQKVCSMCSTSLTNSPTYI